MRGGRGSEESIAKGSRSYPKPGVWRFCCCCCYVQPGVLHKLGWGVGNFVNKVFEVFHDLYAFILDMHAWLGLGLVP